MHLSAKRLVGVLALLITAITGGVLLSEQSRNLLLNPQLSDGILAPKGWGLNASAGNRAVWQVSAEGAPHCILLVGSGRDWVGLTSRRVSASAGEQLTVAAWMRVPQGSQPTDADRLFVRTFHTGRFTGQEGPSLAGLSGKWQVVAGVVTVPEGSDSVDVSVQIRSQAQVQVASVCLLRGHSRDEVADALGPAPEATEWRTVDKAQSLPADANDNGLPDALEAFLGIETDDKAVSARRTRRKTTSFQTPTGYRDDNDLKVDTVIVAGNREDSLRSWAALGYEPHVMVGFRAGPSYLDGRDDGTKHHDEVQTDSRGTLLTCGPGSYYMVPTENRRRIFRQYFADAVRRGAKAACPEEPEFFSRAGHCDAFKREWQAFYGEPWQDPATSVDARFKSERLKVRLERQLLQACYEGARSVDPDVPRFLLAHSPLNYTGWGITFGHHDMLATGEVDAMVAQVWTGTARTAVMYEGKRRERTFENGFLEYASCAGLTRGLPVDLWFLMDPLEDNPDRSMDDYHSNYLRTLAAALMFPEVIHFETMPWPTRIFGRVPDDFATTICSVINVLSDMQNQTEVEWDCGTRGIGTFLSDSAMWQRGAPHPSDLNCFYGLTLPLLMRGIPVEVPHLDRAADPGYLDRYRVLLVSYDMLKPMKPEINEALAAWARNGGCLIVFGGDDPYNDVPEWWRDAGFESPQDHLLSLCGFDVSGKRVLRGVGQDKEWTVVAKTDYTGRSLENQKTETIDLTPFLKTGTALVKCEDSQKNDGWGALITRLRAEGTRDGEPVTMDVRPDTPEERALIATDADSNVNPEGFRFCDANKFVVYRFDFDPGTKAALRLEIGNQYVVSAASGDARVERRFRSCTAANALGVAELSPPASLPVVTYPESGATPIYAIATQAPTPPGGQTDNIADLNRSAMLAGGALLVEKAAGDGWVLHFGVSPSLFARSRERAEQLRALVRYAVETKVEEAYREQGHMKLRRGQYVIAKTFGQDLTLEGQYVNVVSADLPLVSDVRLGPDKLAVLYQVSPDADGTPRLLFASSCVEWKHETESRLRLVVSGASGVFGTCRLFTGGRRIESLRAVNVKGQPVDIETKADGQTTLLRYANEPFGVALDIAWQGA